MGNTKNSTLHHFWVWGAVLRRGIPKNPSTKRGTVDNRNAIVRPVSVVHCEKDKEAVGYSGC